VFAEGPYGAMVADKRKQRKVLLVAGGVGVTPLRALFESLPGAPGDLTLLYRASRHADVVFRRELESLAASRGARLHIVVGRRTEFGVDPLDARTLQTNIADLQAHDVFVCGPAGLAEKTVRSLRAAKVPRRQIHVESFEF
jgi:ferredoxin-NADP reductase